MVTTLPRPALKSKAVPLPTAVADDASSGAVLSLSNETGSDVGGVVFNYGSNGASTSNATYGVWIKTTQTTQQMLIQTAYAQPYIYIENNQIGVRWDDAAGGPLALHRHSPHLGWQLASHHDHLQRQWRPSLFAKTACRHPIRSR